MKKDSNYFVGLDMGTSTVGFAVTDENYNLIRMKGKDFWGIREFDEAQTAAGRRQKRTSRRRRQREIARIGLLKEYFHEAISKEDENFFIRLDNSRFFEEDKDSILSSQNGIFNDVDYKDKDYFAQFPTIFHLRAALIEDSVVADNKYSRLVYLALLNMFKHRGHFLGGEISDSGDASIEKIYADFVNISNALVGVSFPENAHGIVTEILADSSISRTEKAARMFEALGFLKKNKIENVIVKGLCGLKIDATKIFEELSEENKIDIDFSDSSYIDREQEICSAIGEEKYELIDLMKQIYDFGILSKLLQGKRYLSQARVDSYEKHKNDLKILKQVYKTELSAEQYDQMFRFIDKGSYSAYVNSTNSSGVIKENEGLCRRSFLGKGRSREELYSKIKKDLKNCSSKEALYVLHEIENESFLPKQLTSDNGVIPNGLHKIEMEAILRNAEKHLPFLLEKDEYGNTVSQRILKLFHFHMPYYIGPVSEYSKTGWVIRKKAGQVLPWNLEEKIDIDKTRVRFIDNLVRRCTYLAGESVLPKASLLYEKYCVLNEINNLRIGGEKISVNLKQDIYNDLFKKGNRLTRKKIAKYLINRGLLDEEDKLTGVDININNSLASYGKFYKIFGEELEKDSVKENVEKIIYYATIFGDSKKDLEKLLQKDFGNILDSEAIKKICSYKFKDWGRISKEMLELEGCEKGTGEAYTIIQAMWSTNNNFMELLFGENYTFRDELEAKQVKLQKELNSFAPEDLDDYYFSAPVKRMIWQTVLVLKEIRKLMGHDPSRIFIEMTRADGEKGKRTQSRGKQLIELYKKIKDEERDWISEIDKADKDGSLRSKKLYLYYTQCGRCMYTGEPIDLSELFDKNKYDIDHIYPRHFVKDDSLMNNLVLVNKTKNARKSDTYPIERLSDSVYHLWNSLHSQNLITDEKYRRLTCRNPFTDEQKAGFIARQLVETSQGTKAVADLIKQLFSEKTTVVYSKAGNVSDFRNENQLLKSRAINDFHHAKDAYLNIVVGNVYYTKFTLHPMNFIKNELSKDEKKYHYNLDKMFKYDVERNGYVAWRALKEGEKNPTINVVKKVMAKNTPLITRWTFEAKGAIANETLYPAKKAKEDGYIPFKTSDVRLAEVSKYGGFTSVSGAYFFVVEHDDKKKRIRTIESVPIYLKEKIEASENGLLDYCIETLKYKNPRICVPKIRTQSLLEINGFRCRITGRTGKQLYLKSEISLCLDMDWNNYIHDLEKYDNSGIFNKTITKDKNIELYDVLLKKHVNGIYKLRMNAIGGKLESGRDKFIELELDGQCRVLLQMIKISNSEKSANLVDIGASPSTGVMLINKVLKNDCSIYLINQSVTGIYEEKVDLLKV